MDPTQPSETGSQILRMKYGDKTRYQYEKAIERLASWLSKERPSAVHGGKILLPLDADVCIKFLDVECRKTPTTTDSDRTIFKSYSSVNACKSAIKYLHREAGVDVPEKLNRLLADYACGYKRKVAQLKDSGEMSVNEGKRPITTQGFLYLAHMAMTYEKDRSLSTIVHPFLIFCWNLMARSVSVGSIRYDHLCWEGDALVVRFAFTKNDQEGMTDTPPILVFTRGIQLEKSSRLVFDHNAKERFSSWLSKVCAGNQHRFEMLRLPIEDIGTHSFRKGVASELSNTPGGTPAVNVWLRAAWTLGSVQGRYIFAGDGGDQFVGRAATGLNVHGSEFASLPPHFDHVSSEFQMLEEILPSFATFYPPCFRCIVPYLLTSLTYHRAWLESNLPKSHLLFLSPVWRRGILDELAQFVETGHLMNTKTNMRASGVPPHVALSSRQDSIEKAIDAIHQQLLELPDKVCNNIIQQLHHSSFPTEQLTTTLNDSLVKLLDQVRTTLAHNQNEITPTDDQISNHEEDIHSASAFDSWSRRNTSLQRTWTCPTGRIFDVWNAWWEGVPSVDCPPIRLLAPKQFTRGCDRVNFSKLKFVMKTKMAKSRLSDNQVAKLSMSDRSNHFYVCFNEFGRAFFPTYDSSSKRRFNDTKLSTLYDLIKRHHA
ncbi:hypothetical protein AeMF1_004059 [Aphanomyces euteiches]|nr:hypothetical protein AeMF1_004059 [Aphanomyces euteiches]KAH9184872.1 hypothetical protein AeNC1_013152 [Aphanomyces euteiches]